LSLESPSIDLPVASVLTAVKALMFSYAITE